MFLGNFFEITLATARLKLIAGMNYKITGFIWCGINTNKTNSKRYFVAEVF